MSKGTIFLYGPPGSGKTSLGRRLAELLNLPFTDLDQEIVSGSGMNIPEVFAQQGESGFRQMEKGALKRVLEGQRRVVALGGGALLDPENRRRAEEQGTVVCLLASPGCLLHRLAAETDSRPLLSGDASTRLQNLLAERAEHYASFSIQVDTDHKSLAEVARQVQVELGQFFVRGMQTDYEVRVAQGGLATIGELMAELGMHGKVAVVSDANVAGIYSESVCQALQGAGFEPVLVKIPAGEIHKNLETVAYLWDRFLSQRLERSSSVVALGGGVTGDLAGFAAATYLRGVAWVAVPTTLLAMVDASLGGKTGFDLEQGKNLVGAFHSPRLVLADPLTLDTLPEAEFRSGMAEVIKSGIIADPILFELCSRGGAMTRGWLREVICRGMAVKVDLIAADPYEKGQRAALNLGHTIGHALELISGYQLSHGEAVAIGMVAEARLSEALCLAKPGLAQGIADVLRLYDLPTAIPGGMDPDAILAGMRVDKKKVAGELHFALPMEIGRVQVGVRVAGDNLVILKRILEVNR